MNEAPAPVTTATADTAPAAPPAAAAPAAAPAPSLDAAPAPAPAAAPAADQSTAPPVDSTTQQPAQKAPDTYEFKVPDGYTLDTAATGEFSALAKDFNLTQEQAQKLLDLDIKRGQDSAAQAQAQSDGWLKSLPSDKEFGGEKLSENLAVAKKAIDAFGTPELKALLNETRLGNHPEIIRAFYRAGLQISPDNRFVPGGSGVVSGQRDTAKALYPNQNQ